MYIYLHIYIYIYAHICMHTCAPYVPVRLQRSLRRRSSTRSKSASSGPVKRHVARCRAAVPAQRRTAALHIVCIYIYICTCTHPHTHVCVRARVCVCVRVRGCGCGCVGVWVCLCVCTHTHIYIYIFTHVSAVVAASCMARLCDGRPRRFFQRYGGDDTLWSELECVRPRSRHVAMLRTPCGVATARAARCCNLELYIYRTTLWGTPCNERCFVTRSAVTSGVLTEARRRALGPALARHWPGTALAHMAGM
jgi:hypothetical protein